jgi:cell fate (sporulation/competence/biofilm development) regulator YlbF (YheA/YmcA/DUF963 family)
MNEIIAESRAINRRIKSSKEYNKYIYARNALKSNEELYAQVCEYKKRNYEIQTYGGDNPYDEMVQLERDYDELLHNSLVNEYIRAEGRICRLMRDMFAEITADLTFDFLDE